MASAVINNNHVTEDGGSGSVHTYDETFPSLPTSSMANGATNGANGFASWADQASDTADKLKVKSKTTTQVFHVPVEERRYKEVQFGNETNQKCEDISQRFGVKIEICCSKDQSLHVVISGKEENVVEAKRAIILALQTETKEKYKVPRDMHKYIIGTKGSVLKELQSKTATSITVPKPEEKSDFVIISGPKGGIEQAIHEIQLICDEQSKTGFERLQIPKLYHPWIRGPYNATTQQIMDSTGAKINIPPFDSEKEEIVVTGEKEKVDLACAQLMKIFHEKQKLKIKKFEIQIPKTQHKLIIGKSGSTVQDIFKEYDVYVLVPRSESASETVTLYAEEMKVGPAITQVYAKANSVLTEKINAPLWLHRYIIGEKGANITKITADYPSTHVNFEDDDDKITIDGPPDEVNKIKTVLTNVVNDFMKAMTFEDIKIDPKHIGHLVGKNYENVARMRNEYGIQIRVPQDVAAKPQIRIEGPHEGVKKAKAEITELLKRIENERSKDIIIDQKYHSTLIGQGGKTISEIRAKFNDINISIPNAKEKSEVVTVRGNKNDVEQCVKYLQKFLKDLEENNYKEELHIYKKFHKMIIGKQGAFIRKIRDETGTRIDVPQDNSESDTIQIIGKKENVVKARKMLEEKVKELISIEEDFVEIPHNIHNALIGRGGAIIKQIRKDCGGVQINFPPENKPSDKIQLKGPREEIEKAKQELLKLAKNKNELSYSEDVVAKAEYHRYLVGRRGNNVNQLRDKYSVRIIFPHVNESNGEATASTTDGEAAGVTNGKADTITIFGKEENVKKAKAELEATIKSLDELVNDEVDVDTKWHKSFTARRGQLINKISAENCNVKISFPKAGDTTNPTKVKLKGPKEAVEATKKRIAEIVYEFENQVTIEVAIPNKYHNIVIGKKGVHSQKISEDYRVELEFPAKLSNADDNSQENINEPTAAVNGGGGDSSPSKLDLVVVRGLREECEKAKQALLALVPIQEQFDFPNEFHKNLLVNKAEFLRDINVNHNVQINVPKKEEQNANYITLIGTKENIESAKESLKEKLEQYEADKQDRELRNFTIELDIKPEFIPMLRGKQGTDLDKINQKYDVKVSFSKKGEPDRVIIRGYEKNANEAKEEIQKRIEKFESKVVQEIEIDARVHPRIIGAKGKALQKLTDKYKVNIVFPNRGNQSNLLIVQGDDGDLVDDCCEHLRNLEEEFLQDIVDRGQYRHPSRQEEEAKSNANAGKGFVVTGAPWEQQNHNNNTAAAAQTPEVAPDTSNMLDFPTITSAVASGSATSSSKTTWGPSRK